MKRLAVLAVLAMSLAIVPSASAAFGELSFVEPTKVEFTFAGETTKPVTVWLENGGTETVMPEFGTVLEDGEGNPVQPTVEVIGANEEVTTPAPLGAGDVGLYRLVFGEPEESSGQLVARATGVAPASVPLKLAEDLPKARGITVALLLPLAFALLVMIIAWWPVRQTSLGAELGGVAELDFGKSFATTLTAVAALLTTIIGTTILPEETVDISRKGFIGLSLTFAVATAIAGAVAGSVLKPRSVAGDDGPEWKLEGKVWTFLVGAVITLWAVAGVLWTVNLLIGELVTGGGFTELGAWMLRALLIAVAVGLVPYTKTKVKVAVEAPPTPTLAVPAPEKINLL